MEMLEYCGFKSFDILRPLVIGSGLFERDEPKDLRIMLKEEALDRVGRADSSIMMEGGPRLLLVDKELCNISLIPARPLGGEPRGIPDSLGLLEDLLSATGDPGNKWKGIWGPLYSYPKVMLFCSCSIKVIDKLTLLKVSIDFFFCSFALEKGPWKGGEI